MRAPMINPPAQTKDVKRIGSGYQYRDTIQAFGGYNHNLRINEGEWYDEENLSSDFYPVTSARKRRGKVVNAPVCGIAALGSDVYFVKSSNVTKKLYRMHGEDESADTELFDFTALSDVHHAVPRQLVQTGAYIVIFPDGVYYNTIDSNDKGSINNLWAAGDSDTITFDLSDVDGTAYSNVTVSPAAPGSPSDGDYWLDTSNGGKVLKEYSGGEWISVVNTYIKISATNIASGYATGDGVTISGITTAALSDLNSTMVLQAAYHDEANSGAGDYIVVIGIMDDDQYTETGTMKMERKAPTMDFVVEANNRLWGCHYGNNNAGEFVNELYACKLGDFKNWSVFDGLSTDSYMASIGSYGAFTGAITYLGYPLFFKETCLHKVYGNIPANFQINTAACSGVAYGAGNSLAIVDGRLYYKSHDGVCVYDGSLPSDISAALGHASYNGMGTSEVIPNDWQPYFKLRAGAAAGSFNHSYYLFCRRPDQAVNQFFVYDTRLGIWHREEGKSNGVQCFAETPDYLYYSEGGGYASVFRMTTVIDPSAEWWAESGEIGLLLPDKRYISKITLTLSVVIGAEMSIAIQYDGAGDFEHVTTVYGNGMQRVTRTIQPRRCTYFRLRISGKGDAKLYGYTKMIETGSDV